MWGFTKVVSTFFSPAFFSQENEPLIDVPLIVPGKRQIIYQNSVERKTDTKFINWEKKKKKSIFVQTLPLSRPVIPAQKRTLAKEVPVHIMLIKAL